MLEKVKTGTKVINDFQIIRIGPFSEEDGRAYIRELLKNEGQIKQLPSSIIDKFLELIGSSVPYFLQILAKESLYEMGRRKQKLSAVMLLIKLIEKRSSDLPAEPILNIIIQG
ncbi:MAG: hypothetical protein AB1488_10850 [Nitrospirota bacterium]